MHAFVQKKITKYLCTKKSTRYYVAKKKNRRVKLLKNNISSNKYKNIQYA
jgi:hypothetical protein